MAIATRENVAELYVAFFGRAADNNGLNYWVNDAGLNLEQISASFFDQPETREKYPVELSNESFVATIYLNLFNREPDQTGLDYWVAELERFEESDGREGISRDKMILAVVNGAQNIPEENIYDLTILENKTETGLYFADAGLEYIDFYLDTISDDRGEVNILKERVDAIVAQGAPELLIHLDPDITEDDTIDNEETGISIPLGGYVYTQISGSKEVALTVNGNRYTQTVEKNDFSIEVPGSELAADTDRSIDAEFLLTDSEGTVHSVQTQEGYDVVEGDIIPPNAPVLKLPIAEDNMINAEEAQTLSIEGSAEAFSTIDLSIRDSDGTEIVEETFTYTTGEWAVSGLDISGLKNGILRVEVSATDLAGNRSIVTESAMILDTEAPEILDIFLTNDTGLSEIDRVTYDSELTVLVSDPLASVEYSLDQFHWSTEVLEYPEDGRKTVYVRAVDSVGNISEVKTKSFTLDRETPDAPVMEKIASDTGLSASDGVTNDGTLFFSGTSDKGALIEFWLNSESIGTVTASSSGNWTKDYSRTTLEDGMYEVTTRATDIAGNVSVVSEPFAFVVDTSVSLGNIVLSAEDDSGFENDDNYTNVAAAVFEVALGSDVQTGDKIVLLLDGQPLVSTPEYTVTEADVAEGKAHIRMAEEDMGSDGEKTVSAAIRDVAGNIFTTTALQMTLDRVSPDAPSVSLLEDTGIDQSDHVTSNSDYVVSASEENVLLEYSFDGTVWQEEKPEFVVDGTYRLYVRETDLAGNISEAVMHSFTLDETAPQTAVLTMPVTDDNIVNTEEVSAVTLSGMAEAQSMLKINLRDTNGTYIIYETITDSEGKWQLSSLDLNALSDGTVTVEVDSMDRAGNQSLSSQYQFRIDTAQPDVPEISLLWDTGLSDSDHITSSGTLNVVSGSEEDRIEYSVNGSVWSSGQPMYGNDGYYNVLVRAVNTIGSISETAQLQFLLDTTSEPAPIVALRNDSGVEGDLYTNDPALLIIPSNDDGQIEYFWNDIWQATPPAFDGGDGLKTAWVRESDVAGNVSAITEFLFELDATATQAPLITLHNDSGIVGDNITNDGTIDVVLNEESSYAEYSLNGIDWSLEAPLYEADGTYTVYVREIDKAANVSVAQNITFELDRSAAQMIGSAVIGETDTPSLSVDIVLNEIAEAGLYTDPDDLNTLLGLKISVDNEISAGEYAGQIEVSAQAQVLTSVIVAEDVASNRMTGSEKIVLGSVNADQMGDNTSTFSQLLFGFDGDDEIFGGLGRDSFFGGIGSDRFVLEEGSGNTSDIIDVIMDFATTFDTVATGYAGGTNPGDYEEVDGSTFTDLAAIVSDAEGNYLVDGTHYVLYYNASTVQNSTDKVSGYLLIDRGETPDGQVDQVIELVGIVSVDDFDGSDIVI